MAFSNVYDNTFPPDTQLANLLGQDIRTEKLDAQERMAAISGLDAAKPAFGADTQPAKWNGVLFFATDTGKIYQFNNPAWTDLTTSFQFKNPALKNTTLVTQTGDAILHTIYTIAIPGNYLGPAGQLRISLAMLVNSSAGPPTVAINYGGTRITPPLALTAGRNGNASVVIIGGNLGVTNSQSWDMLEFPLFGGPVTPPGGASGVGHQTSAVDSTAAQNLTVTYQGSINADSITFYRLFVELL